MGRNPLNFRELNFKYEVVKVGNLTHVEYTDEYNHLSTYPERQVVLKPLGRFLAKDIYECTVWGKDSLKELRVGELISADLQFATKEDGNGIDVQYIIPGSIFTLNDYYQCREAEALYQGSLRGEKLVAA